jgi:hypothetical protein
MDENSVAGHSGYIRLESAKWTTADFDISLSPIAICEYTP